MLCLSLHCLCKRLAYAKVNMNLRKCVFISWHSSDLHINYKQLINAVMIVLAVEL